MNKKELKEFMVFEDEDGSKGVIIRNKSEFCPWWKCFRTENYIGGAGQIFNNDESDDCFKNIKKLYIPMNGDVEYNALCFMNEGDEYLDYEYICVYDSEKEK